MVLPSSSVIPMVKSRRTASAEASGGPQPSGASLSVRQWPPRRFPRNPMIRGRALPRMGSKERQTIPEPSPRFLGWSLVVGVLIIASVMVVRTWTG
jgi:hypothetical protein